MEKWNDKQWRIQLSNTSDWKVERACAPPVDQHGPPGHTRRLVDREDKLGRLPVDWWVRKTHETRVGRERWLWMVRLCFDRQGIPSHFEVFSKSKLWSSMGPPAHGTFCADLSELDLMGALEQARQDGPVHGLMFFQGHMPLWITL